MACTITTLVEQDSTPLWGAGSVWWSEVSLRLVVLEGEEEVTSSYIQERTEQKQWKREKRRYRHVMPRLASGGVRDVLVGVSRARQLKSARQRQLESARWEWQELVEQEKGQLRQKKLKGETRGTSSGAAGSQVIRWSGESTQTEEEKWGHSCLTLTRPDTGVI